MVKDDFSVFLGKLTDQGYHLVKERVLKKSNLKAREDWHVVLNEIQSVGII